MKFKVSVPQIKLNEWCAALESGAYVQGKHTLCAARSDDDEFKPLSEFIQDHDYDGAPATVDFQHCCLGVLAEVMGVPRYDLDGQILDDIATTAPLCPVTWLGTYEAQDDDQNVDEENHTLQYILAEMNDGRKRDGEYQMLPQTFAEIAAWIREHVEGQL